jgi:RsiW-degrading membrane proteinase PrsW (M82 family)
VVGLAQEMCKYAVVRYTVYLSSEFDEPMDGIVYMMACGTGFAVWVNYHRLSGQGHQVHLSTGAAQAVVTTLAHASFAGLLGYVMGRAKFSQRSAPVRGLFVMLGLLLAAAFNGQFRVISTTTTTFTFAVSGTPDDGADPSGDAPGANANSSAAGVLAAIKGLK